MTYNEVIEKILNYRSNEYIWTKIENFILSLDGDNVKGFVYIIYVGDNLYKIGKTSSLDRRLRELNESRVVRVIRADNITEIENNLHRIFSSKRISSGQELFKLNDEDILYIHNLPDEWEEEVSLF